MATKKPKWSVLQLRQWTDNWQANDYDELLKSGEHKLKIRIHHDYAYRKQCWAKVERWDGTKWHLVASVGDPRFTGTPRGNLFDTNFKPIRDQLLRLAEEIIF